MAPLVIGDDERQKIESIGLGRAGIGLVVEEGLHRRERRVVVGLGAQRADVHHTVSGSMRSYSAWVPHPPPSLATGKGIITVSDEWTLPSRPVHRAHG